jgi:PAS domain S-box-containing protein
MNILASHSLEDTSFQHFFRLTPDSMIMTDLKGQIRDLNPALEKLLGWSSSEILNQNVQDYLPCRDVRRLRYAVEQCLQRQETSFKLELQIRCRNQQLRWVDWSLVIIPQENRVYGVGRDVAAQDLTQTTLLRSETRLRAVVNNAPLIVYALDRDGYFLLSEGCGLDRLGLRPGEVVGQSALELYKDFPETIAALQDALNGEPRRWVAQIQNYFYDCRVSLLKNQKGEIDGLIGVSTDITELMAAQATLENLVLGTASVTGQDFFNALVQYLAIALGVQYAMINDLRGDRFYSLAFWAKGEIQPNINYAVTSAPGCSRVLAVKQCLYVPEMGDDRNCPLLKPLAVNTYLGAPLQSPQGEVLGTLCILNDRPLDNAEQAQRILKIFAARAGAELNRLKAEQALEQLNQELELRVQEQTERWKQSQLQFERLVQNVPGVVYKARFSSPTLEISHTTINFLYISDHIIDLLGLQPQAIEADSQVILSRIHPEDKDDFERSCAKVLQTQDRWIWDGRFLHQNGQYRWLRGTSQVTDCIVEGDNEILIWDGVLIDISDRKVAEMNMELALQEQQEMNDIKSRLITTMSHEFRTPLAVISSSASILKDFSSRLSEEKKQKHLKTIETYIHHTTQLLEDVLALNRLNAGQLSFQPRRINLVGLFSDLIDELYLSHGEYPIHLKVLTANLEDSNDNHHGDIDIKLLRQIVLNLIENAVKYSANKAPVEVVLRLMFSEILLEIKDSGIGILPEDLQKLFEPFYRGKNVGQRSGTGLGLSVVKSCVDLHQGQITVQSQLGQGTVFKIRLPRYNQECIRIS